MPRLPSLNLAKLDNTIDEPEQDTESMADQQSPRIKSTMKTGGGQKSARSLTAYTQVCSRTLSMIRVRWHDDVLTSALSESTLIQ